MDLEKLLAPRADTATGLPEDDVEVPGVGTLRVRGLSRDEVFGTQQTKGGVGAQERQILHLGVLDPELSVAQAGKWQQVSPAGEIEPVVDRIRQLSGMADDADKQAMLGFRDDAGSGVRALSGDAAGDDSGRAAGEDGPG